MTNRALTGGRARTSAAHSHILVSAILSLALIVWVLFPMYLMHSDFLEEKKNHLSLLSFPIEKRPTEKMKQPRDHRPKQGTKTSPAASEEELIDMRELSYTLPFDNPNGGVWTQGWDVEARPVNETHPLTIFVVPHSHCDPGWIKTFDEYFQSQTKGILDTVVDALLKDTRRTFIWAEISYFEWWWREQSQQRQEQTRKLVLETKQLQFVTGGWVQPDEANTQLYAMEIQLQEGHDFIRSAFGEEAIPKYGWAVDPFGHSPTMAYLLNKYGFKGMYIQRVHYAVKKELAKRKHLEFRWRQTWDEAGEHDIFTHLNPYFCYDVPHTCGPDPSICCQFDFSRMSHGGGCPWHKQPKPITDANVEERAMLLLDQYQKKAAVYRANTVIAPVGGDFMWRTSGEAEAQYQNYQKIMDYVNKHVPGVSMQFGTLSDYFENTMSEIDEVPVLKGSFFTYSDVDEDYWSGYFTSRVFDKALDRQLERALFAASSLGATKIELQDPRRALSLFQHHDGVTGTAKDHVVRDYSARMQKAVLEAEDWMVKKLDRRNVKPCWMSDDPRGLRQNVCGEAKPAYAYNPLEISQYCSGIEVPGHSVEEVTLPCEKPSAFSKVRFDDKTGLMTFPFQEQWMVWKVKRGGAYLFFPDTLDSYSDADLQIEEGGLVVSTPHWKRTVVERQLSDEFGNAATVFDFVYETLLQTPNQEWFVLFSSSVNNRGVFHTDLNGFNFDTHRFRKDLPLQSQVFPMPTMASIQDESLRFTVLSEHAQGTASPEEGSIDIWLDRRLTTDDGKGLFQGVQDNVLTRTRLSIVLEHDGYDTDGEFNISPLVRRIWDELNHPLELFGTHDAQKVAQITEQAQMHQLKPKESVEGELSPDSILKGNIQAQDRIVKMMQRNVMLKEGTA